MKLLLPLLCVALVATVDAIPVEAQTDPLHFYHEAIGITSAERIRRAEAADVTDDVSNRIVGGLSADLGDYPYMGGLVITLTSNEISICGSSLLSRKRLVTAAHCWWDGQKQALQFIVVLGSLKLFSGGVRIFTNRVEMHANYNPITRANDIAIISIDGITYTPEISPVKLPNGELREHDFLHWWAVAVGFGISGDAACSAIDPNQTQSHVGMRVITTSACQTWQTNESFQVGANMVCARTDADVRGTCSGDSGGPLVYTEGIKPVLIGIKTFRIVRNNSLNVPAVFTRVTSYNSWIRSRI